jgi:RNA 2',3'-cyclic 3'-phosphodiesterase
VPEMVSGPGADARERLFVAVEVHEAVRTAVDLAVGPLRAEHPDLRWTDPSRWHLTLAFLGDVEGEQRAEVDAAAAGAVAGRSPFRLWLSGDVGTFGRAVLWAGLDPSPELEGLAVALDAELRRRGFDLEERAFVPHLTLARVARGRRLPRRDWNAHVTLPRHGWEAERLVVVRSRLGREGADHQVRSAHPLRA